MEKQNIRIIGVPMELGQNRQGDVSVPNSEESVAKAGAKRLKTITAVYQNIFKIAHEEPVSVIRIL